MNPRGPTSDVAEVFGVERGDVVAVAGAGGKTTLCFGLAHALVRRGWRVLTTTTTKIWPDDAALTERTLLRPTLGELRAAFGEHRHITVGSGILPDGRLAGVGRKGVDAWVCHGIADAVIVEADGARGRPFKAPGAGEPVLPGSTTLFVIAVGLDVLGLPLTPEHVHRVGLVATLSGTPPGAPVTPLAIARVLQYTLGLAPFDLRSAVLLNRADGDPLREAAAREIAGLLPGVACILGEARAGWFVSLS